MPISDRKKDDLSGEARKLADELSQEFSLPVSGTGGESEFRMVTNFFAKKNSTDDLRDLLSGAPPKRSKQTAKYWQAIRQKLTKYLDNCQYSPQELVYLFAWTARLLKRGI